MPRGEMLHTKIAREIKLAEPTATAVERAKRKLDQEEHSKPFSKKKFIASLTEHVGKFIDRLTVDDFITLGAVAGLTVAIQPVLKIAPELVARVQSVGLDLRYLFTGPAGMILELSKHGFFGWDISKGIQGWLFNPSEYTQEFEQVDKQIPDPLAWILAFCVACLIVKFGPAILSQAGGVVKLASGLLGSV